MYKLVSYTFSKSIKEMERKFQYAYHILASIIFRTCILSKKLLKLRMNTCGWLRNTACIP